MTARKPADDPHADDPRAIERERAIEALTEALRTEEPEEKDYQIREALQLLGLRDE